MLFIVRVLLVLIVLCSLHTCLLTSALIYVFITTSGVILTHTHDMYSFQHTPTSVYPYKLDIKCISLFFTSTSKIKIVFPTFEYLYI